MFWPKEIWGRFADSLDDFRVRRQCPTLPGLSLLTDDDMNAVSAQVDVM